MNGFSLVGPVFAAKFPYNQVVLLFLLSEEEKKIDTENKHC